MVSEATLNTVYACWLINKRVDVNLVWHQGFSERTPKCKRGHLKSCLTEKIQKTRSEKLTKI